MDFGKAWVLPLPDTIQEQVNEAIGHGFDGMIVYVDQARETTSILHKWLER